MRIFLGDPFRKRSRIQRYLVRQWIHVASVYGLCLATETGTHSANCAAFCLDKGVDMPVVVQDRRSVQTAQNPVEDPQVQFLDKVVVDMPVVVQRQASCPAVGGRRSTQKPGSTPKWGFRF